MPFWHYLTSLQCDESLPQCRNCVKSNRKCLYFQEQATLVASTSHTDTRAVAAEAALGTEVFAFSIARMTGIATARGATQNSFVYMLRHFEETASSTLSSPTGRRIMKAKVPSIIQQYPFLLHSVLAFSATHLRHLGQLGAEMGIASSFHTQRALQLYAQRLRQPVADDEMDAMLAACLMLTGLSFVAEDHLNPTNAWTTQQTGFRWVTIASGLSILLQAQHTWDRSKSFWLPFLTEARSSQRDEEADLQNLPGMLLEVCECSPSCANHPNPYTPALRILGSMMTVQPDIHTFARLISFPSRLTPDFVDLIYGKDTRALLVLSYWFALMCQIPYWWCFQRVRGDCRAICVYLDGHPDARIRELLRFPKEAIKDHNVQRPVQGEHSTSIGGNRSRAYSLIF
jgi:Fungal specific transcription factor domain